MCGRYTITITEDELIARYIIEEPTNRYHTPRYNIALTMINARADTVTVKPAFKNACKQRRCLIPTDGFYEWMKIGSDKQPYRIY